MSTLSNYVAKLTTNENIYYVLTGNDFDFNLIDLEHPKLFAISNNYATESVISPVIAMMVSITSRSFSMENKVPFVFILDEMTTFKVRDFEKLPSVLREYGAAFLLLTQFGAKLEKLYSKLDRSSIEANFGNIFLGRTQDVEALKYYPLFFGKYETEKKSTSSGSSGGGRNSSVTISTQKEEIYESKDFASLEPGEFIGMGNRSNIKGHFRKKFRLFELEEEPLPVVAFRTEKEISDNYTGILKDIERVLGMEETEEDVNCSLPGETCTAADIGFPSAAVPLAGVQVIYRLASHFFPDLVLSHTKNPPPTTALIVYTKLNMSIIHFILKLYFLF